MVLGAMCKAKGKTKPREFRKFKYFMIGEVQGIENKFYTLHYFKIIISVKWDIYDQLFKWTFHAHYVLILVFFTDI